MADWVTISALATAGGTLVLAVSTFASVRSANRAARVAERSLLAGLRPVVVQSRFEDPMEKVGFVDGHWLKVPGGMAVFEATDDVIYMGLAVRNVGAGLAVLDRWAVLVDVDPGSGFSPVDSMRRLTRDIYVPAGYTGFWQGALRDPTEPLFSALAEAITSRRRLGLDLLYGDHEGSQHVITRFGFTPRDDGQWVAAVSRHWNVDRSDPR